MLPKIRTQKPMSTMENRNPNIEVNPKNFLSRETKPLDKTKVNKNRLQFLYKMSIDKMEEILYNKGTK